MPKAKSSADGKLIGTVSHYFGKIGVAVINLAGALSVGDKIRIAGNEAEFEQTVDSMEAEHERLAKAKKGDSIGLKVEGKAKEGYKVYKL